MGWLPLRPPPSRRTTQSMVQATYLRLPKFFTSLAREQQTALLPFYIELSKDLFLSTHGPSASSEEFHRQYCRQAERSAIVLDRRLRNGSHAFYGREPLL